MKQGFKKISVLQLAGLVCTIFTSLTCVVAAQLQTQSGAQDWVGIYELKQTEPNLAGDGIKFALICRSMTYLDGKPQNDYQPETNHNCLADKNFSLHDEGKLPAKVSPHSTAICSILFGRDRQVYNSTLGQFNCEGITTKSEADIYEFWHFLKNNVFGNKPPDADIITASFGSPFEDWWTRGIDSMVQRHNVIVVASIGNGQKSHDTTLYPAANANVIGVGVVSSVSSQNLATNLSNFTLAYPETSSCGPTAENRCKPDIVAVGNFMAADINEPNGYKPTGDFASFSTPAVTGTIGLLLEKAKSTPALTNAFDAVGSNCVIKAILMNSATKLPYWHKGKLTKDDDHTVPLDYIQGAGMLNAKAAYEQLTAGEQKSGQIKKIGWDLNKLNSEIPENVYEINIAEPNNNLLCATLVWNRHFSPSYPFMAETEKDVDLQIEIWAIDTNDPNKDYLLDYSNSPVDNVEHIYTKLDPNYTRYEIAVSYSDDDANNSIVYSLAWNIKAKSANNSILWYDLNSDGVVNDKDLATPFVNSISILRNKKDYPFGDVNNDGQIDSADLKIFAEHKGQTADWYKQKPATN